MYCPDEVIFEFKKLKYQLNRIKTQKWVDKYNKIEFYQDQYITFRRFCDECEEYFSRMYQDEETPYTIQEVFDYLN